jgi:hypothetical protein
MIKNINYQNVLTTPFVVRKDWSLSSIQNDDLVLIEQSASVEEIPVALDYIDYYGSSFSFVNSECSIALEQQTPDTVIYREGEKRSGIFYPELEPQNIDGTYKRLVYSQLEKAFYNFYRNPLQIFGIENIDFQLGKTERYISEFFREFEVPQYIFGDKITKGTVILTDNSLDDVVVVQDDAYGNLYAKENLFSKIQEVRHLGNVILDGYVDHGCIVPIFKVYEPPTLLIASATSSTFGGDPIYPYTISLDWSDNSSNEDGFYIYRKVTADNISWTNWTHLATKGQNVTHHLDIMFDTFVSMSYKVSAYNVLGETPYSNTASVDIDSALVP